MGGSFFDARSHYFQVLKFKKKNRFRTDDVNLLYQRQSSSIGHIFGLAKKEEEEWKKKKNERNRKWENVTTSSFVDGHGQSLYLTQERKKVFLIRVENFASSIYVQGFFYFYFFFVLLYIVTYDKLTSNVLHFQFINNTSE